MILRALVRVVEFLVILLIVRLVLRAVVGFFAAPAGDRQQAQRPEAKGLEGVDMVKDRVCNTFIPRGQAIAARVGGDEEFFCSAGCRDKAVAALRRAS